MKPSFNKTIKSKDKKNKIKEEEFATNSITADNIDNNQIISGYFLNEKPYKEMVIQRVNNFLYVVLGLMVTFCFVAYYFVSCQEVELNKISRETLELNYENDELQNKIDTLQSYYNIDRAVSKANILERAKHVIEVDAIDIPNLDLSGKSKNKHSTVVGY